MKTTKTTLTLAAIVVVLLVAAPAFAQPPERARTPRHAPAVRTPQARQPARAARRPTAVIHRPTIRRPAPVVRPRPVRRPAPVVTLSVSSQTAQFREVRHLIVQLQKGPAHRRESAARRLGYIGDPRANYALTQAFHYDVNRRVRNAAKKALRRIAARTQPVWHGARRRVRPNIVRFLFGW